MKVKEERNSEIKGTGRETLKGEHVAKVQLSLPLEKKAPSVTGRSTFILTRFVIHAPFLWLYNPSFSLRSELIFILPIHFVSILFSFVFLCRLFDLLFTGVWQSLGSLLVFIYFGTIVFVSVIVFQCHFLIFCCSLSTGCAWNVKANFPGGVFNFIKNPNEPAKIEYEHTAQISYEQSAILILIVILIGVIFFIKK